ncbi:MAG TPA: DUF4214 domain-containing protein, partial [Anaerolineales bacterium]|nr:DUF4214 domain-containing protein [Anaerolineales bacterium]
MANFVKTNHVDSKHFIEEVDQIKSGDFNSDGNADFVVSRINWSDQGTSPVPLQIFLGDGQGNFSDQTSTIFESGVPYVHYVPRMIVADFNNDGVSDLFCIDNGIDKAPWSGGQNELFLSSNGLLIDSTSLLPQGLKNNHGASVGDVNQDGRLDILVNALMFDGNDLQIQDSTGQFVSSPNQMPNLAIPNYSGPQTNTWSGLIDINQDGKVDMILGKWDNQWSSSKYSQVYINDNNGGFSGSAATNLPHSPVDQEIVLDIKPIDLNGDNLPDLALSVTNGGDANSFYHTAYVQLLVNDGGGNFHDETSIRFAQSPTATPDFNWIKSITVTDLNHDGFSDLVLDNDSLSGKVVMNDGNGHFSQVQELNKYSKNVVVDVNKDGMSDLIVSGPTSGNIDGFDIYLNSMTNGHIYKANFGGDTLLGSNQADRFISGDGNDNFTGNGGVDVVQMHGSKSNYTITTANGVTTVKDNTKADGVDAMVDIDRIQFSDKTVAFDLDGNAGQVYRLYQAAFDRVPDQGGLGYWINEIDRGMGLSQVATGFIDSAEFKALYGNNPSNAEFVTLLYDNVLHRTPDAGGYSYWMEQLSSGMTRENVLIGFSESTENKVALMAF